MIVWLGGGITQGALKAFLARWVPVVGAGAMALWARHSTSPMGRKACEILEREILFDEEESPE